MSWKNKNWRYTRVQDQGPDYLRRKFEKLKKESKWTSTTPETNQDGNSKTKPIVSSKK